jgi:hypothetical protein
MCSIAKWASLATNSLSRTVYVTVCAPSSSSTSIKPSGVASSTIASTGVKTSPTPTGSPIAYATGAAAVNAVSGSALGMIIAGGVALVCDLWNDFIIIFGVENAH